MGVPRAVAASDDWIGATQDWFTASNWSSAAVPTSSDQVTIDTGASKPAIISGTGASSFGATLGSTAGSLGNVVTVDIGGSWIVGPGNLVVGASGSGALTIQRGGFVYTGGTVNIGSAAGGQGSVVVDGTGGPSSIGTSMTGVGAIVVGNLGTGSLSIVNGGSAYSLQAAVGNIAGSKGNVVLDGPNSSWTNTGPMSIGLFGLGTVNVTGGAALRSDTVTIGGASGNFASNTLVIDGVSSIAQIKTSLAVGDGGLGILEVTNGGVVSAASAGTVIGNQANSIGSAKVWGAGTTFVTKTLTIGASGGGVLGIAAGGSVSVDGGLGNVDLAQNVGSQGLIVISADPSSPTIAPGPINAATITMGAGTAAIEFNHPGTAYVFSPSIIGGSNGVIKQFDGVTSLTGNSSGYSGTTTVNGGTLLVNGTLGGTLNVDGGILGGFGTAAGPVFVNSGGTLAPGDGTSGTSMTVAGNLAFQAGAMYLVAVNPSTASFANVTGTATLGGATVKAAFANGSYISKQYTILNATGGVSGSFASNVVSTNLPANFSTNLSYDAAHAYLNISLNFTPPSAAPNFGSGLTVNQANVAAGLVNSFNTAGAIPMVFGALTPTGLTQASGELATGSQQTTFDAMNLFMGLLTDPFMGGGNGIGDAIAPTDYVEEHNLVSASAARRTTDAFAMLTKAPASAFQPRWRLWGAGFGGSQSTGGNATVGSNNATTNIYGTAVGADYLLSPHTVAGFALTGGGANFAVTNGGSGRSDLFQAGAHLRHTNGPFYLSAALAYGWQNITANRTVTAAGIDQLRAQFDANAFSGRFEGGYRFVARAIGGIGITAYAATQFVTFDLPAYAEHAVAGISPFALSYAAKCLTDARSELGLRADRFIALEDAVLTLRGRLAWAHDYDPDRSAAATFQALPSASFVVNGAAQAADSALTTASAELKWKNGWSVAATFEGEFSNVTNSYAGKGVVRYQW